MRSLWFKLMGAFVLVILIGVITDAFLVNQITTAQFNRYVTQSGRLWTQQLAPTLADYYARTGSWQGVETALRNPWMAAAGNAQPPQGRSRWTGMNGMRGGMMDREMDDEMMGRGMNDSMGMRGDDMLAWMGLRLLLADESGQVVVDTASVATGTRLSAADMSAGTPVLVDGRQVGTLLAVSTTADVTTPAGDFVSAVNGSTWLAGLAAGVLALVLGLLLFRQIVAPVRAVTTAAQHLAAGQLDRRVPVTSQDEVGQLARTFNHMAEALARDRQLRQTMMADIAHELRTPLSIIQANLEAMLDGVLPASPPEIASLHDETTLLSRLVADLRLLSLAEAGQLKLERAETDPGDLVKKVVDRMATQAHENEITLVTDIAPNLPWLEVDADRISQAIGNLVSNALRYTPTGGTVTVRAYIGAANPQSASARHPTKDERRPVIIIKVSDTGPGIAPADLPHVFDRFYRADKSRSRASGGSGIGLAIVKQLVEAHGGQVGVASQAGQGTTFTITLPSIATSTSPRRFRPAQPE
jgi:two-component system OmpR family sensor kinase